MTSEVEQLYTCVICGRAWDNAQSLRAHMKAHKGKYRRSTYWTPIELDDKFKEVARKHKTNTCNLLIPFIEAIVEGEGKGIIDIPKLISANPIFINLTTVYTGTPRSPLKIKIPTSFLDRNVCNICGSRKVRTRKLNFEPFTEVVCLDCESDALVHDKKSLPAVE